MMVEPETALPPQGTCEHGQKWASLHTVCEAWAGSGQGQVRGWPLPWLACGSPMTHSGTHTPGQEAAFRTAWSLEPL